MTFILSRFIRVTHTSDGPIKLLLSLLLKINAWREQILFTLLLKRIFRWYGYSRNLPVYLICVTCQRLVSNRWHKPRSACDTRYVIIRWHIKFFLLESSSSATLLTKGTVSFYVIFILLWALAQNSVIHLNTISTDIRNFNLKICSKTWFKCFCWLYDDIWMTKGDFQCLCLCSRNTNLKIMSSEEDNILFPCIDNKKSENFPRLWTRQQQYNIKRTENREIKKSSLVSQN